MNPIQYLLIGTGQLGSRHLQALARTPEPSVITIVEPFDQARETAIQRFKEIPGHEKHQLKAYASLEEIQGQVFQLAVIATNADVRASVVKTLLQHHAIPYLILEKVVFQTEADFESVGQLLESKGVKAWVNCTRRSFPYYHSLKNYLKDKTLKRFQLHGVDWGLACNSVHHLDLLTFLTGNSDFILTENHLENKIYTSKRPGFIEFYGSYQGKLSQDTNFEIQCLPKTSEEEKPSSYYLLETSDERIEIRESQAEVSFFKLNTNELLRKEPLEMIYQSNLTQQQAAQILSTGASDLPDFATSYKEHSFLFQVLRQTIQKAENKTLLTLPIT